MLWNEAPQAFAETLREHGLRRAADSGSTPAEEAVRLADELAGEPHPIWPDRGRQIIDYLEASGWGDIGRE